VFEPLLLHVEINPLFPPPFVYREKWRGHSQSQSVQTAHHLIGCSLQAFVEVTRRRWGARATPEPYQVHHVEFENAVLVHPDAASAMFADRSPSAGSKQSHKDILDKYLAGYFCHPLRGVLSMREVIAQYDFRAWLDPDVSLARKASRMRRFLDRAWSSASGRDRDILARRPYSLSWSEPAG
ncbi:unnamed protein product, partial [Polarella glacialis]